MSTKTKTPRKKIVKSTPIEEPVPAPVVESVPVHEEASTQPVDKFTEILDRLQNFKKEIGVLIDDVKKLQKEKKRVRSGNVKSGFSKQVKLSANLSAFLNLPPEQLMSRVDVTKLVTEYIKDNNLQIQENRQHFRIDDKLSSLFNIDKNTELHYFKLQSHLKHHYPKDV